MSAAEVLGSAALFAELPAYARDELALLMHPFEAQAGSLLFREADPGDRMYVIESGLLQVARSSLREQDLHLGLVERGGILGELSLLGSGVRTATVRVLEDTTGWALDRPVFEALSADPRPGSLLLLRRLRELALARLRNRYSAIGHSLEASGAAAEPAEPPLEEVAADPGEAAYLRSLLWFSLMSADGVTEIAAGARRLFASRGDTILMPGAVPPALYLVLRGAVETTVRGAGRVQRLRLAGPGRAVGHVGARGPEPSAVEFRARERAILLEFRWDRVAALLEGSDATARGFAKAFGADVVRALDQADRPMARMIVPAAVA